MKKIIIIFLAAVVILTPGGLIKAAYNDLRTTDVVTVNISDLGINLTVANGANVESMTVNTGTINLTLRSGSSIIITSADRRTLGSSFANSTFTCPSSGASTLTITTTQDSVTGTVTPSSGSCTPASGGGGGGGGGGISPPPPSVITPANVSVAINTGATMAYSHAATLALSATNAVQMIVSENPDFSGASWEAYAAAKIWTLSGGLGKKTVYAKFKSSTGNESSVVSDDIIILAAPAAQTLAASVGGHAGLAGDLVAVDIPAKALPQNANITITPTASYVSANAGKLVGSQVYDFKADANGTPVTTFKKNVILTFKYTADDIRGISERSLGVYYWNETSNTWVRLDSNVDVAAKTVSASINHFTVFAIFGEESMVSGGLVKLTCTGKNQDVCSAVYYIGNNGKRYVFPNDKTYFTWYGDFSGVREITPTELASYAIGGNATYRPGVRMVKITSSPAVYVVSKGGMLREIPSEIVARDIYGVNWNQQIDDVPDSFFINYKTGTKLISASDFSIVQEKAVVPTINLDKGL